MERMDFVPANRAIMEAREFITYRRGRKWFDLVAEGDTVKLGVAGEDAVVGHALVTAKQLTTYGEAVATHPDPLALKGSMIEAYGDINGGDELSAITLKRIGFE